MGLIISRFRDKPSTRDTLEKIEQEIQNIEERRWDKIRREQFIVQILSFLPLTIITANFIILIYPTETSWRDKFILSLPVALFNLLLWLSRKSVQWYSRWSLDKEEIRMRMLQKQKKKILEMVCETESYRVATELLEKYDPKQLRRKSDKNVFSDGLQSPLNSPLSRTTTSLMAPRTPQHRSKQQPPPPSSSVQPQYHQHSLLQNTSLHQSHNLSTTFTQSIMNPLPVAPPSTPITARKSSARQQNNVPPQNLNMSFNTTAVATSSVQGRPVRPILSKDRGLLERFVDWVVADGPDNRFALICRFCYGHNGMSLAEEFESINFRCCYCYNLNTAINKNNQKKDQLQPDRNRAAEIGSILEEHEEQSRKKITTKKTEKDKSDDIMEKLESNGSSKADDGFLAQVDKEVQEEGEETHSTATIQDLQDLEMEKVVKSSDTTKTKTLKNMDQE